MAALFRFGLYLVDTLPFETLDDGTMVDLTHGFYDFLFIFFICIEQQVVIAEI